VGELFERDILEAAMNVAIDHHEMIPDLLAANGLSIDDAGQIEQYRELLLRLQEAHTKGERVDRSVLASRLAEVSQRYKSREDWKAVLASFEGRGSIDSFPLFTDRLRLLRLRRRVAILGHEAENGCYPDDLLSGLDGAKTDYEASVAAEPLAVLDLSIEPPPPSKPLVGDDHRQVLMPGEIIGIAADPGVGKTKLLTELAFGIASGTEALGFPCVQQPVVYVSSDGDPHLAQNFHRQWSRRGSGAGLLADLPLSVFSDDDFCLADPIWYARLVKTLIRVGASKGPVTCFIESLATNVLNPEDLVDQVKVRQFVRATIRRMMRTFPGLTVPISCHLRKTQPGGMNDLGTRVAGSVQIRGAVDCLIGLVPAGRDAFTVRRVKRSRSGGDFEPFKVQIEGARTEPLTLRNLGPVEVSRDEARGAAAAVMIVMRRECRTMTIDSLAEAIPSFKKRAIQAACKGLSEAEKPLLIRASKKPAAYSLVPDQPDPSFQGLD
jgi:AAA domain